MESAPPAVKSLMAGLFSGTCSTLLFQPLDLVKTRIQSSVILGAPVGMVKTVSRVVQHDTVVGLWRGLVPSVWRSVPGIGIYFCSIHTIRSKFESKSPRALESMLIGGSARSIAAVTMLPFTVLKIRFESGQFDYKTMGRAMVVLYKTEGIKGMYSGLAPTLLRDVPFSGLYFMFYSQMKMLFTPYTSCDTRTPYQLMSFHWCCGITAGMLASVITQPADVVKTRMQLYPQKYSRLELAVLSVYEKDGFVGFWRGIVPRTLRRTLMAAMAWTLYEEVTRKCGLTQKTD